MGFNKQRNIDQRCNFATSFISWALFIYWWVHSNSIQLVNHYCIFKRVGKVLVSYFRCCFLSAPSWRTQTRMTLWCRKSLTCTRQTVPSMSQRLGAGPRNMQWASLVNGKKNLRILFPHYSLCINQVWICGDCSCDILNRQSEE